MGERWCGVFDAPEVEDVAFQPRHAVILHAVEGVRVEAWVRERERGGGDRIGYINTIN